MADSKPKPKPAATGHGNFSLGGFVGKASKKKASWFQKGAKRPSKK